MSYNELTEISIICLISVLTSALHIEKALSSGPWNKFYAAKATLQGFFICHIRLKFARCDHHSTMVTLISTPGKKIDSVRSFVYFLCVIFSICRVFRGFFLLVGVTKNKNALEFGFLAKNWLVREYFFVSKSNFQKLFVYIFV